jgi:hypothetical protein
LVLSSRRYGEDRTGRAADDLLCDAATYRVNESVSALGRHYERVGFTRGVKNRRHNIALAAEFFPSTCLTLGARELRQRTSIHVKQLDFHGLIAKSLGSADSANHSLLRIRLVVNR